MKHHFRQTSVAYCPVGSAEYVWAANQYSKSASGSRLTWENCSLFDPLVFFFLIQLLGKRSRAAAQSNHENTSLGWSLRSINPLLCEYKILNFFYISLHFNTKSVCIQIIQKFHKTYSTSAGRSHGMPHLISPCTVVAQLNSGSKSLRGSTESVTLVFPVVFW